VQIGLTWIAQELCLLFKTRFPLSERAAAVALARALRRRARAAPPRQHHRLLAQRTTRLRRHQRRSNAPNEAMNALITKIKTVRHGFRNFDNYRLRLLRCCGVDWEHSTTGVAMTH
jgi:transposase